MLTVKLTTLTTKEGFLIPGLGKLEPVNIHTSGLPVLDVLMVQHT